MKTKRILLTSLLIVALGGLSLSGCTQKNASEIYGKVTAVNGSEITVAVGTLNDGSSGTTNSTTSSGGTATANSSNGAQGSPSANGSATTPPEKPAGSESSASSDQSSTGGSGTPSAPPSGSPSGGMPEMLTLTGETKTMTLSDSVSITRQAMGQPSGTTNSGNTAAAESTTATVADISINSVLKITYTGNTVASIEILSGGGQPGGSTTANTGTGAYTLASGETLEGGTYGSTNVDENAIRAENGITASLNNVTVTKTGGAASSSDASSFYGLNAAILALGDAILNVTGGSVTASTEGANGVFAYDGATINISDTTINASGGNAGGIEVAGGGILNAKNLTVNTTSKAAIRSDRGGGTLTVDGGTYTTSGSTGAPAIYSTAAITASNATLIANSSEAVVVEGMNSVTLNNCVVSGNMTGSNGSAADNLHNVMLYQSMSGDAQVGNSSFNMTGGSLTSNSGDMFYVTNTTSSISLSSVTLSPAANTYLLLVSGNDGSRGWGTAGANGGKCTLTASSQQLEGNIKVDAISTLDLTIKDGSALTGAINNDSTTAQSLKVTLDSSSTWTLTADSYVTEFSGSMSNVALNGHTLYVNGVAQN